MKINDAVTRMLERLNYRVALLNMKLMAWQMNIKNKQAKKKKVNKYV